VGSVVGAVVGVSPTNVGVGSFVRVAVGIGVGVGEYSLSLSFPHAVRTEPTAAALKATDKALLLNTDNAGIPLSLLIYLLLT
ncbi:MAG: hypothetical protein Q8P26_04550, partial [Candidatus Levybacteria bacterium]|nr:hypothetical protein [Candidatus Levybacteria bacterium]